MSMTAPEDNWPADPAKLIGRTTAFVLRDGAASPKMIIRGFGVHTRLLVLATQPAAGGSAGRLHTIDFMDPSAATLVIAPQPPAPLMQVTIRDHAAEAPWGSGLTNPRTRSLTLVATCPNCGGPRGEPKGLNQYDDGVHYWVTTWTNDCGHQDYYWAVAIEAGLRRSP